MDTKDIIRLMDATIQHTRRHRHTLKTAKEGSPEWHDALMFCWEQSRYLPLACKRMLDEYNKRW